MSIPPRPWRVGTADHHKPYILAADGEPVLDMEDSSEAAEAAAEHIVRCVNEAAEIERLIDREPTPAGDPLAQHPAVARFYDEHPMDFHNPQKGAGHEAREALLERMLEDGRQLSHAYEDLQRAMPDVVAALEAAAEGTDDVYRMVEIADLCRAALAKLRPPADWNPTGAGEIVLRGSGAIMSGVHSDPRAFTVAAPLPESWSHGDVRVKLDGELHVRPVSNEGGRPRWGGPCGCGTDCALQQSVLREDGFLDHDELLAKVRP